MTRDEKLRHCAGCRDDFYNDKNPMGVKECWGLRTAKMVTAFKIGTWTVPTQPNAFTKVRKLSCWHQEGSHFYDQLPHFVKPSEVTDAT